MTSQESLFSPLTDVDLFRHLIVDLHDDVAGKARFEQTLKRFQDEGVISQREAEDLERLMSLRNPLSHYRDVNDESNLESRAVHT